MIFNSTLLLGLTLHTITNNSPLLTYSSTMINSKFSIDSFQLSHFYTSALRISNLKSEISISNSDFSYFMNSTISIQSFCNTFIEQAFPNFHFGFKFCTIIQNCSFSNCKDNVCGGAIFCNISSKFDFQIDRTNFTNCSSGLSGGAIYLIADVAIQPPTSQITFCNFIGCYLQRENSSLYGGSVYCKHTQVNFRCSIFNESRIIGGDKAYGGALYAELANSSKQMFFANFSNCECINQSQTSYNSSCGGAIYLNVTNPNAEFNMSYNSFTECNATNGTCIYISGTITQLILNYTIFDTDDGTLIELEDPKKINNVEYGTFAMTGIDTNARNISIINKELHVKEIDIPNFYVGNNIQEVQDKVEEDLSVAFNTPMYPFPGIPFSPPANASDDIESGLPTPAPTITSEPINSESESVSGDDITISEEASPDDSNVPVSNNSGLSTIAIIFIVIACVLVVVAIIIIIILVCRQRGKCKTSYERNFAHEMGSTTYF